MVCQPGLNTLGSSVAAHPIDSFPPSPNSSPRRCIPRSALIQKFVAHVLIPISNIRSNARNILVRPGSIWLPLALAILQQIPSLSCLWSVWLACPPGLKLNDLDRCSRTLFSGETLLMNIWFARLAVLLARTFPVGMPTRRWLGVPILAFPHLPSQCS